MAILRPIILPTVGSPSVAVLPRRQRNLTQQDFYKQQQDAGSPVDQSALGGAAQRFSQDPLTGDYFKSQLDKYANRPAPPALEPNARVQNPNTTLTQPDNFKSYYDSLATITDIGNQMTGAETAKAAYRRQQELQAAAKQNVAGFTMPTLQAGPTGSYSGGGVASGGGGSVPSNPAANFRFAQNIAPRYNWGPNELGAWYTLGMKESGWRNDAQNPTSTAYGIGQFLDTTWNGYGIGKTSDPGLQVEAMARYIKGRYGTPSAALAFHRNNNWY